MRGLPRVPRRRNVRGHSHARQVLRLPRGGDGDERNREKLYRPIRDAQPRTAMGRLRAAAGERFLFAQRAREAGGDDVRELSRPDGRERLAAGLSGGPDQRLFGGYLEGERHQSWNENGGLRGLPPHQADGTKLPGLPQMKTTRRDILLFAGGSAVGVLMTPAPWRLITDSALWSENWTGIPRPARGAITAKYTNCALCAAGCAVRARCVAEQPVSLAGVAGHPLSHGALCAYGLAGHHLPYHPARITRGPAQEAAAAVAGAMARLGANEHGAVLDLRPGRTASWTYRRAMAAVKNGVYVAVGGAVTNAAIDLTRARTVLSLGGPLLEGWGTPGNVIAARAGFHLIQAEAVESRTAAMADQWLRIKPGSEEALRQGILQALSGQSVRAAAEATGIPEQQLVALASELKQNGPALIVGGGESQSAAQLNEALGALGHIIVARREAPVPDAWKKAPPGVDLASVEDGSIRVLLIDESAPGAYLPWSAVEPKLVRDNPVVVTLGWTREG